MAFHLIYDVEVSLTYSQRYVHYYETALNHPCLSLMTIGNKPTVHDSGGAKRVCRSTFHRPSLWFIEINEIKKFLVMFNFCIHFGHEKRFRISKSN